MFLDISENPQKDKIEDGDQLLGLAEFYKDCLKAIEILSSERKAAAFWGRRKIRLRISKGLTVQLGRLLQ